MAAQLHLPGKHATWHRLSFAQLQFPVRTCLQESWRPKNYYLGSVSENCHCCHFRPTSLAALLALKRQHPDAKLVVGNTEVGIEMKFKAAAYPVLIGTTHVPELNQASGTLLRTLRSRLV